jgi:hypothetical protein
MAFGLLNVGGVGWVIVTSTADTSADATSTVADVPEGKLAFQRPKPSVSMYAVTV